MENMEKRGLLAIVLSLIILFSWQFFLAKKRPIPVPQETVTPVATVPSDTSSSKNRYNTHEDSISQRSPEKEIVVETALYKAVFSTKNGVIKSWRLKNYKDHIGKDAESVEMIHQSDLGSSPLYLTLRLPNYENQKEFNYEVNEQYPTEFKLVYQDRLLMIERHYKFSEETYAFTHTVRISPTSKKGEALFQSGRGEVYVGLSEVSSPAQTKNIFSSPNADVKSFLYFIHDKISRKPIEKTNENIELKQVIDWMGIENRYFLSALINRSFLKPYLFITKPSVESHSIELQFPFHKEASKNYVELILSGYFGPKDLTHLKKTEPILEQAINFGMLSFFCVLLLKTLNFFYHFFGNYGVAIILLTLLIRVLFHPLTKKSLQSMREMQRIQPEIAKVKEQYKDDRERMNREIMEIMKSNKVNPLGGCLPLLFQMPIFFALYRVLYNAIELYQAPFFGWIQDLSSKDPYYVTPVLMGISMFVQQKMTPNTSMDPAQQKMMMIMPVVFSFFMIGLPSGLVIYIFFSTALQILSQYLVNREFAKKTN